MHATCIVKYQRISSSSLEIEFKIVLLKTNCLSTLKNLISLLNFISFVWINVKT